MEKTVKEPKERMRMNIELADNGIIIRNPECEDEVTIALHGRFDNDCARDDEYKAIGKKIFDWLMDEIFESNNDIIITNFDIDLVATCKGRAIQ